MSKLAQLDEKLDQKMRDSIKKKIGVEPELFGQYGRSGDANALGVIASRNIRWLWLFNRIVARRAAGGGIPPKFVLILTKDKVYAYSYWMIGWRLHLRRKLREWDRDKVTATLRKGDASMLGVGRALVDNPDRLTIEPADGSKPLKGVALDMEVSEQFVEALSGKTTDGRLGDVVVDIQ